MKRILFILGVLGTMGLTASFTGGNELSTGGGTGLGNDDGCGGGSRVCCSSPGQNHP